MEEITKFYDWMERMGNIYLADFQSMDRAFEKVRNSCEDCDKFVDNETE